MGKLSQYTRNRIISLRESNTSIVNIVKILQTVTGTLPPLLLMVKS